MLLSLNNTHNQKLSISIYLSPFSSNYFVFDISVMGLIFVFIIGYTKTAYNKNTIPKKLLVLSKE